MNPHTHHCFLADDLSGALEVGAVFHRHNRFVRVSLRSSPLPRWDAGTVLGFDLDSRVKTSGEAYKSVFDLATALRKDGHPFILKKIDSTLRGWVGQEIQAVLDSKCADAVALCPTNPNAGRTVVDGMLLVEGVPVHQTAFGRDPGFPIRTSRVDEIIPAQTNAPLRQCPLQLVRSSGHSLTAWITETLDSGISILSFDGVTEQDLESIAQATLAFDARILPCGSGAMAAAVGGILDGRADGGPEESGKQSSIGQKRTAFLIGSAHPGSLAQFEHLDRARSLIVCRFDPNAPATWPDTVRRSVRAMEGGVIALVPEPQGDGGHLVETAIRIQEFFDWFSKEIPPEELPRNWFITGGETARTVIDALSLETLDIVDELEPGIAIARFRPLTQPDSDHTLITKPGGFGGPDALIDCYDYLVG